jgi:hypothetical protein
MGGNTRRQKSKNSRRHVGVALTERPALVNVREPRDAIALGVVEIPKYAVGELPAFDFQAGNRAL